MARNKQFKDSNFLTIKDNKYFFTPEEDGLYYFRIQAMVNGHLGPVGNTLRYQFNYPPVRFTQSKFEQQYQARNPADVGAKKKFPLQWNAVPTAEKYVIEVSEDTSFKNAYRKTVTTPAGNAVVPKTGNYFFRVLPLNKQGRMISSDPSVGEIIYRQVVKPAQPVLEKAFKSMNYYFQKQYGEFVWLKWVAQEKGTKYRLEISRDKDFNKLNFSYVVPENKFLIKSKLPQGQYFWRVRSEADGTVSDWSDIGIVKIQTK